MTLLEVVGAALGLLVVVAPFLIGLYTKHYSDKAAEEKRRKEEDQAAVEERGKNQDEVKSDAAAHNAQEKAERKWREDHGT